MGLDMYLYAKKYVSSGMEIDPEGNAYEEIISVAGLSKSDLPIEEYGSLTISVKAMYWRKANAIHNWFVANVQDGEDNCREYEVGREQLRELRELCDKVLNDHSLASELLPTQAGFFFGSTEFDEYYFADLEDTRNAIDKLLDEKSPLNAKTGFGAWWFEYQSSW